jgi:hypothetical protein
VVDKVTLQFSPVVLILLAIGWPEIVFYTSWFNQLNMFHTDWITNSWFNFHTVECQFAPYHNKQLDKHNKTFKI